MAADPFAGALAKLRLTRAELDGAKPTDYDRTTMHAFTPLEGRYARYTDQLRGITSEFQAVKRRLGLEIEYLIALGDEFQNYRGSTPRLIERPFSDKERQALSGVYKGFSEKDYAMFKMLEGRTDHDVVAIVLLGQYKLGDVVRPDVLERAMHFGRTSSDMDSNVCSLMMHDILGMYYLPRMLGLQRMFIGKAGEWHKVPEGYRRPFTVIAAHTHEQPAVPTPLKKVVANIAHQVNQGISPLLRTGPDGKDARFRLYGKMGGAVGNDEAMIAAYPGHDWRAFYKRFIEGLGLEYQAATDQDESNMRLLELFGIIRLANLPLLKWSDDYSSYLSRGVLKKRTREGEAGSSIMPQKVNPWRTEGGESAIYVADAELGAFELLARQRKQGDLRRSYMKRYMGVPMANTVVAIGRMQEDLERTVPNHEGIEIELERHPAIASASVQTMLRAHGVPGAYRRMCELTRGRHVTPEIMDSALDEMVRDGSITGKTAEGIKQVFRPENNVGDALEQADTQLAEALDTLKRLEKAYEIQCAA
jgi:adenylosuccinate lyase